MQFLDSSPLVRKPKKPKPIKDNLRDAAKSLRSGKLLTFADAMQKTMRATTSESQQLTMTMLKEITKAARRSLTTSEKIAVAVGDTVSSRLLGLAQTKIQALVQPPDLDSIPMVGNDLLKSATLKRELGIITLEEYKHLSLIHI